MSKKNSKNSEKTSKFKNLTISERIQKCRELIYGIKEEKSEKVVINYETIEDKDNLKFKNSRSQKNDDCFGDLQLKAVNSLDEEEENKYFGSGIEDESEISKNINYEKEINLDKIDENFYKNPPKIRECRVMLNDIKMKNSNKKFKNLASKSIKIGTQYSKNEENEIIQISKSTNNLEQENQSRINENVKTEAEEQLLVILPQEKVQKFPVPFEIKDNQPKFDNFQCQICKKKFNHFDFLKRHQNIHDKKFECQICGKKYSLKCFLLSHIRNFHENPLSFKCKVCNIRFNTKANLDSHQKIHMKSRPKPLKCSKCDYATDLKANLNKHLKNHERIIKKCGKCNKILKNKAHDCRLDCKYCGKEYKHRVTVLTHIKNNHAHETGKSIYECDICGSKFYRKKPVRIHMNRKHADGKIKVFTCDLDGKTFKMKAKIVSHMKVHSARVKCEFCHKKVCIRHLKIHIKNSHTGIKQALKKQSTRNCIPKTETFQCQICFKILSTKSILDRHVTEHNKTIKCEFCEKLFGNQPRLNYHVRYYHENPNSFSCKICGKKFTRSSCLKCHMKIHDPNRVRDLKCSQCDFATDDKNHFENHLNSHKKRNAKIAAIINPHKCPKCSSVSKSKSGLYQHMIIVHPKALLECDICGIKIKAKGSMLAHFRGFHKIGSDTRRHQP